MHESTQPGADDPALYLRGLIALRDGALDDATALLTQALRRQPGHPGMRRNLVRALLLSGCFDQVLLHANAVLASDPRDAEMHYARGTALNALGQPTKGCAALARALALQPNNASAWLNMANASVDAGDLAGAETMYRTAITLDPNLAEAHASLGHLLLEQARFYAATEACETAVRLRPDFAQAHWNLAAALLLGGDLERGFREYEWRKSHPSFRRDFLGLPGRYWQGEPLDGRVILVRAEQGLGDTIQFARYLPVLRELGGRPILVCAPTLVPLFQSMPGIRAVPKQNPLPAHDVWADLLSLPHLLGAKLETIPAPSGYLRAQPESAARWDQFLPKGRRIGLVLAGNPNHKADKRRSIPFALAKILTGIPNVVWINLQHGPAAAQLQRAGGPVDLTERLPDYAETAALIENLDLVISADTSVAHLAGALGKPAWVLLPQAPDWRWLLERSDSPWYRSIRLFRQSQAGDWTGVLKDVRTSLTSLP